jgi:hypothetical protein
MSGSVKAVSSPQASPSSSSASSPPSMPPPRPRELRHCHAAAAGRVVIMPLLLLLQPPPHGQHPPALGGSSSWAHPTAPTTHPPTHTSLPGGLRRGEAGELGKVELELPRSARSLHRAALGSANPGWGIARFGGRGAGTLWRLERWECGGGDCCGVRRGEGPGVQRIWGRERRGRCAS